jgi:4-diphosphocytidyl-2-C-methyl-D-erythritol kinase
MTAARAIEDGIMGAVETARAKINLTLRVHGRRGDGFHELESLVAFADEGDRLALRPAAAGTFDLSVMGTFAGAIAGDNLVEIAWQLFADCARGAVGAHVVLEKRLPVASGIGGGSADAAALLRAAARAFPYAVAQFDLHAIARRLGADVPVCLVSQPAVMTGTGERIARVSLPRLDVVLVNPAIPVPPDKTRRVFTALAAGPVGDLAPLVVPRLDDLDAVLAFARSCGNDLERAAVSVVPAIGAVKQAVMQSSACLHAMLSGAGPTVVGLYSCPEDAVQAAGEIARDNPDWWVRATALGSRPDLLPDATLAN